jgi:putative addiction module component (TIGR02574 family)
MTTAPEVLHAAMSLGTDERAAIAHQLLLSLEPDVADDDVEQAWAEEIRRRLCAIREGRVALRDWDDALTDIRRSITEGPHEAPDRS